MLGVRCFPIRCLTAAGRLPKFSRTGSSRGATKRLVMHWRAKLLAPSIVYINPPGSVPATLESSVSIPHPTPTVDLQLLPALVFSVFWSSANIHLALPFGLDQV
jgi:hypothetical protein